MNAVSKGTRIGAIIEHFGGLDDMAEEFECHTMTIRTWVKTGHIPRGRRYEIEVRSEGKWSAPRLLGDQRGPSASSE